MASPDLDALIVKHLADLDRVVARIEHIQNQVFTAMGDLAEEWAAEHEWVSNFIYPDEGWFEWSAWLAPPEWRTADTKPEDEKFDAWFELGVGAGDSEGGKEGEDWFYLTRLCEIGVGQIGLRFCHNGIMTPRRWKQAFPRLADILLETAFIPDQEPSFFLPIKIEATALAAALGDEEPKSALDPFKDALEKLVGTKPAFDKLIKQMRLPSA